MNSASGRHFVFWSFETLILKIQCILQQIRIQEQIIILEPPHNKFSTLHMHCIGSHIQITYIQRRDNVRLAAILFFDDLTP